MSQLITRNEIEDLCEGELQSKFYAIMSDLIRTQNMLNERAMALAMRIPQHNRNASQQGRTHHGEQRHHVGEAGDIGGIPAIVERRPQRPAI